MKNLGEVFIQDFVTSAGRETLLHTIASTQDPDFYEAVSQELYRRDTERLRQYWIQIMTGNQ
jgi:hypothetical protein